MNLIARQSGGRNLVGRQQALVDFYPLTDLAPAIVEIYSRYDNEAPGAARLVGRYLPGQTASIPFNPADPRNLILSTISVSGAGVRSVANLRDAPEFLVPFAGTAPGNAAADGATKGIATFKAADFNDNSAGLISLDYANGQKASASQPGFLSAADWSAFAAAAAPGNAAADGVTKGIATFLAGDFNDNGAGLISLDYANGQKASASVPGFLTAADWSTFNGKQAAGSYQPLDSDLTAIAALAPANDSIIQRKSGAWVDRTIAQLLTDLGYEEGTWTPVLTGWTTTGGAPTITGKFTRIGRLVMIEATITPAGGGGTLGATNAGASKITGMPYAGGTGNTPGAWTDTSNINSGGFMLMAATNFWVVTNIPTSTQAIVVTCVYQK